MLSATKFDVEIVNQRLVSSIMSRKILGEETCRKDLLLKSEASRSSEEASTHRKKTANKGDCQERVDKRHLPGQSSTKTYQAHNVADWKRELFETSALFLPKYTLR
ncbi:hypothetical protein ONS96_012401 [Cadophora gregata f. sp. sojae]|nr:hypothetical protein ONS96_007510 [Cadophora gregata f. sp. sojae]KAK0119348.1 hypothetical protein ONS96_012401 [Cadophora gregata f. sp. sojae]